VQIRTASGYILSAPGNSSASPKAFVAEVLSPIQSLGAPTQCEICGLTLNLGPLDWGRLIGAYVATFFVVGQIINLVFFRTPPTLPIVVGGLFIVSGGAIITLWQR
jgi:hypothetical protein